MADKPYSLVQAIRDATGQDGRFTRQDDYPELFPDLTEYR
jgi:hypothetical protein